MNAKKQKPDELDEIAQAEDELLTDLSAQHVIRLQQEMSLKISDLSTVITSLEKRINHYEKSIEKTRTTTEAMSSLSLQNRKLQEDFHYREVSLPQFNSLISIADRCREQMARFKQYKDQSANSLKLAAEKAFCFLLKARAADIFEINNTLAMFGVEPFTTEEDIFNSSTQKVIQRIETQDKKLAKKIAQRLQPGYARGEQIIRREYVSVYYLKS